MRQMSFAQIGTLYNSISNELEGGVTQQNQDLLLNQVSTVQTQVQGLIDSGALNGFVDPASGGNVAVVHAQNIADQMNFLKAQINSFGTDSFTPKFINDVVRDVQDIVAGDPTLSSLAHQGNHSGFQQVSYLLTPPTPFPDSGAQTTTLLQFISDSNSLAQRAQTLAGTDPNSAAVQSLINDIHTFSTNADAYSSAQGGLFSARFNNEFTINGVQGTASNELIKGLQTGNAALVNGAASVLTANASDVQGNMLTTGQTFTPAANGGIPADISDVHTAGVVFNDAMTKLIGGVYSGNQASIVNDLNATETGLQAAIGNQSITGHALNDINHVLSLLSEESSLVSGINTASPTQVSTSNGQIGHIQSQILNIVNHDTTLATLAAGTDGTTGFVALPSGVTAHMNGGAHVAGVAGTTGIAVAPNAAAAGNGTAAAGQAAGNTAGTGAGADAAGQGNATAAGAGGTTAAAQTGTGTAAAGQADANTASDGLAHNHFADFVHQPANNHFDLLWHHG